MRKKKERQQREAAAEPARKLDWIPFVAKHSPWLALILVALATFRIVATYDIFNHTVDEPAHVASGIEYLAKNQYTLEPHHPPLGRLAVALWPFLDGRRPYGRQDYIAEGVLILYDGAQYDRTLAHARTGVLPFFWIACAVVFLGGLYLGRLPALLALLIFTTTPLVLAHSGLATNDTAGTAFTGGSGARRGGGSDERAGAAVEVLLPAVRSGGAGGDPGGVDLAVEAASGCVSAIHAVAAGGGDPGGAADGLGGIRIFHGPGGVSGESGVARARVMAGHPRPGKAQ
jgi:hypothetical protein